MRHPVARAILAVLEGGASHTTRSLTSAIRSLKRQDYEVRNTNDQVVYAQAGKLVRHGLIQKELKRGRRVIWSKTQTEES